MGDIFSLIINWNKNDDINTIPGGPDTIFFITAFANSNNFKLLLTTYDSRFYYELTKTGGVWKKFIPLALVSIDDDNKSSLTLSGNLTVAGAINGIASSADFILNNNASLGYRQPNTAYTVGNIAYHSNLPTGWYLECTTAGASSSGELVISSPVIGNTITDGTVTWTLFCKQHNFLAGLPTVKGDADNYEKYGSYGIYEGKSVLNLPTTMGILNVFSAYNGGFALQEAVDVTNNISLERSRKDGIWKSWRQRELIVAKSLGTNSYIKYASGLIVQWGANDMAQNWDAANNIITIAFPISFNTKRKVVANHNDAENANTNVLISSKNAQNPLSSCVFRRYSVDGANQFYGEFCWMAIGY